MVCQELLQSLGLRSFAPQVTACPGCGRTTSTVFQELADKIQDYLRTQMPVWKQRYPGVEELKVAVMGCIVNGPGESKHADIGISLPGTGESPAAPVFIDGQKAMTLRGERHRPGVPERSSPTTSSAASAKRQEERMSRLQIEGRLQPDGADRHPQGRRIAAPSGCLGSESHAGAACELEIMPSATRSSGRRSTSTSASRVCCAANQPAGRQGRCTALTRGARLRAPRPLYIPVESRDKPSRAASATPTRLQPSMSTLRPVRGTHDIVGEDALRHRKVVETGREVAARYGYAEIATPIFEFTEVFARTLGETSDVVTKEMYTFTDRGGETVTLRPEYTAGVARAFISGSLGQNLPIKLFCTGPMFRYERPQKGRLRQFHQIDVEVIGAPEPLADVEVIALGAQILRALGP